MNELRLIIDELFDALNDGDLEAMLAALERLDTWREQDRGRARPHRVHIRLTRPRWGRA